jgi:peptidyl-prolyl cis-trans isomerase D
LVVTPDKFLARLNPGEAELAAYYQGHQAEFRQPERVKVNYLLLRPQDFLDRVKLTPEEVKNYLAEHTEEFYRPTVVRARQLLLTVSPKATAEERQKVEKLAQDLLERARSGEDFSRLAQQYSQDGRTRDRGGELGEVKRSEAQPEWAKVAFALKAGEVGLASTPQGFHLILVEEIKEKEKLPDAEAQARDRLREVKSRALAQETAQKAWEALPRSSLGEVAKKFGLTPKETPLLALKDPLPELGGYSKFNQAALKLKPGEIGRVLELPQCFIVLQGVDRRAEYLPPLPEVKEKVREAVKRQQAKGEAEKEAARLLDNLKKGEPLNRVAAQTGLSLNQSEPFTRFQGFLGQPLAEALTSAAFQLSSQQPYPAQPLFWKDKYYVLAFKARTAPNQEEFAREEDQLRKAALEQKREQIFTGWLNAERRRAKIKIYELL